MAEQPLPAEILSALRDLGVATIYEAWGGTGAMDPAIHAMWPGARACGPAYTVRCHPGDNLPLHRAFEFVSPGDVIVCQASGMLAGYWGGIMTVAAQMRGVVGLLIDGGIRDSEEIHRIGFPVFARGTGVFRTVKHEKGDLQIPIMVGGVLVRPGDIIIADGDGVMSVERERVDFALEAGREREAKERATVERIRKGELTMDIYGWR